MTLARFELLSTEPIARNAKLFRAADFAVLVEPGRGVTELREPRVHHPLDVSRSWAGGAGDVLIVTRDGAIHRFVPGAPPVRRWDSRADADRVTPTGLGEDRLLVAVYGRLFHTVALIERGEQRWWRRGLPTPCLANGELVVRWDQLSWRDTRAALSLVDLATGRDRWRVGMTQLLTALAAHPAQAIAAKLVIKLRGDAPAHARWGPAWVGAVADRLWFTWDARDFGSFVLGVDRATGALAAATPLQTVAPDGHLVGGKLHLLTAGRYEIFDLERDGARVATEHLQLPTVQCDVRSVLDDGRALLASRFGHLFLVDHRAPNATRVLLHRPDEYIDVPVLAGGRLYVVHRRERSAALTVLE
jgi:hypothetical protein